MLVSIVFYSCRLMPKAIKVGDCILLTVGEGVVFEPIIASGTVESENEVLIRCPYTSIVKKIYKEPGSHVQKGDAILMMEDELIKEEIDKIKDQLDLKRNALEKNKLNEFSTTVDLNYSEEVKKLNINSLKTQLADEGQLLEVGGISPAKIEKTKEEISLAEKDLLMLKQKKCHTVKTVNCGGAGVKSWDKDPGERVSRQSEYSQPNACACPFGWNYLVNFQ